LMTLTTRIPTRVAHPWRTGDGEVIRGWRMTRMRLAVAAPCSCSRGRNRMTTTLLGAPGLAFRASPPLLLAPLKQVLWLTRHSDEKPGLLLRLQLQPTRRRTCVISSRGLMDVGMPSTTTRRPAPRRAAAEGARLRLQWTNGLLWNGGRWTERHRAEGSRRLSEEGSQRMAPALVPAVAVGKAPGGHLLVPGRLDRRRSRRCRQQQPVLRCGHQVHRLASCVAL